MAISGRIPLTVWMGDLKLTTYAYVFPQLSVDCLLGVNTLSKNGMIIDCNAKRLYVALLVVLGPSMPSCRGGGGPGNS